MPSDSLGRLAKVVREQDRSSSPFAKLPVELFFAIIAFLGLQELCSLRLVNHAMYCLTFDQFCKTFLHNIATDLSLDSLERLNSLSRDSRMSPYVHTLSIKGKDGSDELGDGHDWDRTQRRYMDMSQEPVQLLQGIILRLEKCRSFHLYKQSPRSNSAPHYPKPDDAVSIILEIITSIERPLLELSFIFKMLRFSNVHQMNMRVINTNLFRKRALVNACSGLEALTFHFRVTNLKTVKFIKQLIRHATSLRRLTINADCGRRAQNLISCLSFPELRRPLQELNLSDIRMVSSHSLINFLTTFKDSLSKLSLEYIRLDSGDWKSVLHALASTFPCLTGISLLENLQSGEPGSLGTPIYQLFFPFIVRDPTVDPELRTKFDYTENVSQQNGKVLTQLVAYSGPGMDIALRKLADYAMVRIDGVYVPTAAAALMAVPI